MISAYTQTSSGKFEPTNIVAVGGVKCQHCRQIIHPQGLEKHLNKHLVENNDIAKKYQISLNKATSPKALSIANMITQEDNDLSTIEEISVKSLLPQQLPAAQKRQRPEGFKLKSSSLQKNIKETANIFQKDFNMAYNFEQLSEKETQEEFNQLSQIKNLEPSCSPELHISKQVLFNQKSQKIKKNKIAIFEAEQQKQNRQVDFYEEKEKVKPNRNPLEQSSQNQRFYEIMKNNESPKKLKLKNTENKQIISIEFSTKRKALHHKQKISTLSTSRGFFTKTNQSNFWINNSSMAKNAQNTQASLNAGYNSQFACRQCKGFYCYACGSTIPPKYRPVPTKNQNFSDNFSKESEKMIRRYYESSREYRKGCTDCQ